MPRDWSQIAAASPNTGGTPSPGVTGSRWDAIKQAGPQEAPPSAPADTEALAAEDYAPTEEPGWNVPAMLAGGAALGGAALLASKPGRIGKIAGGLNALRQQLMLSGFALPKSMLGNVGAAVNASAERGTMAPLKELFSGQTLKDAVQSFKTGSGAALNPAGHNVTNLPKALSLPGRLMGSLDEATQQALQRAGLTAKESATETLQAPLTGGLGQAFESPVASYLHPFRRTPFNQFIEGLKSFQGGQGPLGLLGSHPKTQAAYLAAGAAHGAATSEDKAPLSIPLTVAAAGRRGLPYGLAALAGRLASSGKGGGQIASSVLPVSEYGYEQSLGNPLAPFKEPAAFKAIKRVTGQ